MFLTKESAIQGRGIFASCDIRRGESICRFLGEVVDIPELIKRFDDGTIRFGDDFQMGMESYLDTPKPYVFMNHSCTPNCCFVGEDTLQAVRPIAENEEITFDYSLTEWSLRDKLGKYGHWSMNCTCKASNCRQVIRDFSYLPHELQEQFVRERLVRNFIVEKWRDCLAINHSALAITVSP